MECLVTKLRASVADDSLRVLGEFRFAKRNDVAHTADSAYFQINSESKTKITILNDGYFCKANSAEKDPSLGKSVEVPANTMSQYWISPGSEVRIAPKYDITYMTSSWMVVDLAEYAYVNKISSIMVGGKGFSGSVEHLANIEHLKIIDVSESNYQVYGSLEKIKNLAELTSVALAKSHVTGDITRCFGKSVRLTRMFLADTDMTGSIEALVAAQIAAGRPNGTIQMPYAKVCRGITFEGVTLNTNTNLPTANDSNQFSWTADGTITWS